MNFQSIEDSDHSEKTERLKVSFTDSDDLIGVAPNMEVVSGCVSEKENHIPSIYPQYCCSPLRSNCPSFKKPLVSSQICSTCEMRICEGCFLGFNVDKCFMCIEDNSNNKIELQDLPDSMN